MNNELRRLPSVDRVLSSPQLKELVAAYPHQLLVSLARQQLDSLRAAFLSGGPVTGDVLNVAVERVKESIRLLERPSLRPVINATGVVLHTNLGRAPLSREAVEAMHRVSTGYSNLEFDLDAGIRGSRQGHIEQLMRQLTGAEAALVVNNNAAAVLLGLITLAGRREVIVSRGEAVEIGDSFRIPDVMRQSGAKLIEVGTTNCTYASDYEQAITPRTAALMRVHSSNFKVVGFTHPVSLEEVIAVARRHELPVFEDLGSGCFLDTTAFGLQAEPVVQESIAAGADLVFFSGDKLVGGPQAGIIIGKKQLVDKLRRHPLARAVRIDKTRLAALAATLVHYLKDEATRKVPIWVMIATPTEEIERRARRWMEALGGRGAVIDGESMVGGGSLPGGTLPTRLLAIRVPHRKGKPGAEALARQLREQDMPIVARVSEDMLLLDPRTVMPGEDGVVMAALSRLAESIGGGA